MRKSLILEGLAVLGEEYQAILKEAFESRWIDVFENKGKRSGAYSSGTYGTSPYILMNWQDNIDNVFTLAHELGHSVHSYMTRKYQPFVYGDYSIFLAEVASTTNEILLTDFMLKKFDDPKIKAYLINHYLDGFKGTVFRQTQFAQFEHLIHDAQQNGTALTADFLDEELL
jgi:oligoendopeptidase F